MEIKELTKEEFNLFSQKHNQGSYYQTTFHGEIMKSINFDYITIGLKDDNDNIIAGALIIYKNIMGNFKYGYSPRGFIIDYKNFELLKEFTQKIKIYLKRKGFIFVTIDPLVENNNLNITKNLKKLHYNHFGYNLEFETLKPRINAILELKKNEKYIWPKLTKEMRNKVKKARNKGVEIYKGNENELENFYKFIEKKHIRSLNYYKNYYKILKENNMMDIYFAKINPNEFVKNAHNLYNKEKERNNNITTKIHDSTRRNNNRIINLKLDSDKLMTIYREYIKIGSSLISEYPNGIEIASLAVIKHNKKAYFLISGYKDKYKNYCGNHLIKWAVMENLAKEGYKEFNLNGISGHTSTKDKYYGLNRFKLAFGSRRVEYIGQYDLIIMPSLYHINKNIKKNQKFI